MINLAQKIFDITPDWLRVRIFELTDEEKFFLEVAKENRKRIWEYIISGPRSQEQLKECEQGRTTMEFLLRKYGNGRFCKYFRSKIDLFNYDIKLFLGYH
jgi:hypothetical protein